MNTVYNFISTNYKNYYETFNNNKPSLKVLLLGVFALQAFLYLIYICCCFFSTSFVVSFIVILPYYFIFIYISQKFFKGLGVFEGFSLFIVKIFLLFNLLFTFIVFFQCVLPLFLLLINFFILVCLYCFLEFKVLSFYFTKFYYNLVYKYFYCINLYLINFLFLQFFIHKILFYYSFYLQKNFPLKLFYYSFFYTELSRCLFYLIIFLSYLLFNLIIYVQKFPLLFFTINFLRENFYFSFLFSFVRYLKTYLSLFINLFKNFVYIQKSFYYRTDSFFVEFGLILIFTLILVVLLVNSVNLIYFVESFNSYSDKSSVVVTVVGHQWYWDYTIYYNVGMLN